MFLSLFFIYGLSIAYSLSYQQQHNVISWLNGNYDNIQQSTYDASKGLTLASLGGHEHVSVTLQSHPQSSTAIIAAFNFAYDKSKTFRFRLYQFIVPNSNQSNHNISMKIFRLKGKVDLKLKGLNYDLTKFCPNIDDFEEVQGCDVIWKPNGILSQLALNLKLDRLASYKGKLVTGTAQVVSERDPSLTLVVKDDLTLWHDRLWINDQVFTLQGQRIIGNTRNIPYKFIRKS